MSDPVEYLEIARDYTKAYGFECNDGELYCAMAEKPNSDLVCLQYNGSQYPSDYHRVIGGMSGKVAMLRADFLKEFSIEDGVLASNKTGPFNGVLIEPGFITNFVGGIRRTHKSNRTAALVMAKMTFEELMQNENWTVDKKAVNVKNVLAVEDPRFIHLCNYVRENLDALKAKEPSLAPLALSLFVLAGAVMTKLKSKKPAVKKEKKQKKEAVSVAAK
jgi:hypothetical protein